ncbi:MAG: hypothetical protein ACOYM9_07200 [Bradymonadia bacterium]
MHGAFFVLWTLLLDPAALPPAAHVDWTNDVVSVRGVGAPRILSPTGHLHDEDPVEVARRNAREHVVALLARPSVIDPAAWGTWVQARTARIAFERPRRFSDGTVWVDGRMPLAEVAPSTPADLVVALPVGTPPEFALVLVNRAGARCVVGAGTSVVLRWRQGAAPGEVTVTGTSAGWAAAVAGVDWPACGTLRVVEARTP